MRNTIAFQSRVLLGVLFLIFSGFALQALATTPWRNPDASTAPHVDPFPRPAGLRDAVRFWHQVFGVWQRNQIALHDSEHLGVVYEIIDLPGVVGETETVTPAQRAYVEERRRALENVLRELQSRVRYGVALSNPQQHLLNTITHGASRSALEGASARVRSQRGMRELFLRGLETSGRYDGLFRQVFREAGLPEDLAYLPHLESSYNPHAQSSAGAAGMWQFMPSAGRQFLRMNQAVDERYDPVLAAYGAARYLADAYARLGDWALAVTSYNHGVGGMVRAKQQFGADIERIVRHYRGRAFGFSSRNFYAELLAVRDIVADLRSYFPTGVHFEPPLNHERIRLRYPATAGHLAELFDVDRHALAQLNPAWTQAAVKGRYTLPADTEVWLPKGITLQIANARLQSQPVTLAAARPLRHSGAQAKAGVHKARSKASTKWAKTKTPAPKRKERLHTVRRGESLHSIAAKYGIQPTQLLTLNDITRHSTIHPGQHLRIPGAQAKDSAPARTVAHETRTKRVKAKTPAPKREEQLHTVRRGESLYHIAAKYGIQLTKLLTLNAITHSSIIRPGQRLRIPMR